jgi:hypothetical protein
MDLIINKEIKMPNAERDEDEEGGGDELHPLFEGLDIDQPPEDEGDADASEHASKGKLSEQVSVASDEDMQRAIADAQERTAAASPPYSGLNATQRKHVRNAVAHAANLAYKKRSAIHYTQGPRRWSGIANRLIAIKGKFPPYADCSAFATWTLWNGLYLLYKLPDIVNGERWRAGYTGTLKMHGKTIKNEKNILVGDLALYPRHVEVCIGGGKAISHGSEAGPSLVRLNRRNDRIVLKRYI